MPRFTRKTGGRKHRKHRKQSRRKCLKKCKICKKIKGKSCKKYCRRCIKSKKHYGGSKSGSYVLKPAGYSINTNEILRGSQSSLANPPPYKAYKM